MLMMWVDTMIESTTEFDLYWNLLWALAHAWSAFRGHFDLFFVSIYITLHCISIYAKKNIGTLYFILFHYLSLSIPICETNNKISIVLSNQKSSYGQLTLNNYSNHIFSIIKWEQILKWMKLPSNCTNNAHH